MKWVVNTWKRPLRSRNPFYHLSEFFPLKFSTPFSTSFSIVITESSGYPQRRINQSNFTVMVSSSNFWRSALHGEKLFSVTLHSGATLRFGDGLTIHHLWPIARPPEAPPNVCPDYSIFEGKILTFSCPDLAYFRLFQVIFEFSLSGFSIFQEISDQ